MKTIKLTDIEIEQMAEKEYPLLDNEEYHDHNLRVKIYREIFIKGFKAALKIKTKKIADK